MIITNWISHVPAPGFWILTAAGITVCFAAALVFWVCVRSGRMFELSPHEAALQQLEAARALMNPEAAREYCHVVSTILRGYVEEQMQLRVSRLSNEEFLHEIVDVPNRLVPEHCGLLGDFLQHYDLAKGAGWQYPLAALEDMHETGVEFVLQSSTPPVRATPRDAQLRTQSNSAGKY